MTLRTLPGPVRPARGPASPATPKPVNRLINPLVDAVLRSRLHPLLSRHVMLLSFHVRRTGRAVRAPVRYARSRGYLYVLVGRPEHRTWWRGLRRLTPVRMLIAGTELDGVAEMTTGPAEVLAGLRVYLRTFPRAARSIGVPLDAFRRPDETALHDAAEGAVLIRIRTFG